MCSAKTKDLIGFNGVNTARLMGATSAAIFELLIFYPVDTMAKRLMTNQVARSNVEMSQNYSKVIFRDAYRDSFLERYTSLFPGLTFAAGHKILQRIYRFGGQPIIRDYLQKHHRTWFTDTFGLVHGKPILYATAGSLIGIGEMFLLPLDVLKIRAQTNPCAIGSKGILYILKTERWALYRGAFWTAARNAPGSFALFGGSAACKEYIFHLENYNDATFLETFVSSVAGASASVIIAQPLDVIKTRVQSQSFETPLSGVAVIRKLLAEEGPRAFVKGLVTKLSVVGPKLVFSFSLAQHLIAHLEKSFMAPTLQQ